MPPCQQGKRSPARNEQKRGESLSEPIIVAGDFADLERAVRDVCKQIDLLAQHIPDDEDRAYAEVAKENLWHMYQSAHQRALAREGLGR